MMETLSTLQLGGDDTVIASIVRSAKTLIVQFGQSNATKHDPIANLTAANIRFGTSYANVQQIVQWDTTFNDNPMVWEDFGPDSLGPELTNPLGTGTSLNIGFEASLLRDLDIARPRTFALANIAVGGASSVQFDPASAYPSATAPPNLYAQIVTFIQSAMASLSCTSVVLVWQQGEADALTTALGTAYQAWLTAFIAAIRASLGAIGPGGTVIPFVFGELNAGINPGTYLGLTQLRASQVAVAGAVSRTTLVNADGITVASGNYDGVHYTANGYVLLGHLLSPAVAAYCGILIQPQATFTKSTIARAVFFTDTSISPGDTVTSWAWAFGDGNTSTLQNPVHVYAANGTYSVTLTVTNTAANSNTSAAVSTGALVGGTGFAGVTRDPTSLLYRPATASEWTTFLTAISNPVGAPDILINCQEQGVNAGDVNLLDLVNALAFAPTGAPTYGASVTGQTALGLAMADNTVTNFQCASSPIPDIGTGNITLLALVKFPSAAPSAARSILTVGVSPNLASMSLTSGGLAQMASGVNLATGASHIDGNTHLVAIKVDRTGTLCVGYTDISKMTPAFRATMAGQYASIGAATASGRTAGVTVEYLVGWVGTKAQISDANMKLLMQGFNHDTGYTIPWT